MELLCVRGAVSRSMQSGTIDMLCILLIGKKSGTSDLVVELVDDSFCCFPTGLTPAKLKEFSPCHNHVDCVHVRAVLERIIELGSAGSTDETNTWIKGSNGTKVNANQPSVELIADCVEMSRDLKCATIRSQFNPLTYEDRKALTLPPSDEDINLLVTYREAKIETNKYKDRGLKINMVPEIDDDFD
ncbi:hypothetical protein SARC_10481 [Sphaeroforma arctica JP610]|uniref:Uncharacterized protein n=1 Tax=Sphaeroforma arctica JP610 TaxID=667725 RepID=A0A0L0FJU7_9EUKA|nr:hypothetical protein SARC_10481 [Sphaeroforma arctica JP610]KNC77049.1 hypothetical protein SARC_10481 [Sphaeroforma arctica JP610]|eukprot:XP_014150951.1 hypothetical protein SARC_10481 [Sphaeroforma arctica JP610]